MNDGAEMNEARSVPEAIVLEWWKELQERRGDRAELRRAHALSEIVFTPAYQRLWRRLQGSAWHYADGVALVVGVLAHVTVNDPGEKFAAQLAAPQHGDKPRYSGLRFRRLLQYQEKSELLEPMRRAVVQVDRHANVMDLADSLYGWNDYVRRQWAFSYYGKNPKAE